MSGNTVFASNVTSESDGASLNFSSSKSMTPLPPFTLPVSIMHFFLAGISAVIVASEVFAERLLSRCKRIPYQCLRLSISYLLSDTVGAIFFIVYQLLIYGFGLNTDFLHNSSITTVAVMNNISSASITAIILERVFALKANLKYTLALKQIEIHLIIISIWILHMLITVCVICVSLYQKCDWKLSDCDVWEVNKATKYVCGGIMIIYDIILVSSNRIVYRISRRHAAQIDAMEQITHIDGQGNPDSVSVRQYASLKIIIKLVAANLLLKTPIIVATSVSTNFTSFRDETPLRIFRTLSYLCIQINSFVNLYLYIWKMQECRMMFFFAVSRFFKRYERKAEMLRLEVYDIVTIKNYTEA